MSRLLAPSCVVAVLILAGSDSVSAQAQQPKTPPADAFGDPLPDGAFARLGTTRFRHGGKDLLSLTPDAKAVIYLGGGALHLIDVDSGKETKAISLGDSAPRAFRRFDFDTSITLSSDTKVLAIASQSGNNGITIFDAETGKERKRFASNEIFKNGQPIFQPSICLSGDGKYLLVSTGQGGERLPVAWLDTNTGNRAHEIEPAKDCSFRNAKFSRDGREVVAVENNNNDGKMRLRFFDTRRGTEIRSVDLPGGNNNGLFHFELRPDGKTLVASNGQGQPGPVKLYDSTAGKELKEVRAFSDVQPGSAFTLSRDGKELFIAGQGRVHHWDVDAGKEIRQIEAPNLPHNDFGGFGPGGRMVRNSLAVSLDGKTLVVSGNQSFAIFDIPTGKQRAGASGGATISIVRFMPDGKGLIVGNSDHVLQQWEPKGGKLTRTLDRPDKERPPQPRGFDFFSIFLGSASFSDDGKLLAVGLGESGVGVWDAATGKFLKHFGLEEGKENLGGGERIPTSFAFAPGSHVLATGLSNGTIKLWDADSGQGLRSWTWHTAAGNRGGGFDAGMLSLAFSPDGKTLVGGGMINFNDGLPQATLIYWETATGKERLRQRANIQGFGNGDFGLDLIFLLLDQMALSSTYSPDGKTLALGTFSGIHLVDAFTGKDITSYSGRLLFGKTATFSPDGKLLFVGRVDGMLRILDTTTGRVVRDVPGHMEPIFTLALSPDGKTLASGSNDSTVLLWSVAELCKPASAAKAALTAKELDNLWQDLADEDAGKAFAAINALITVPAEATSLLKEHIKVVAPADPKVVEKLLEDLNSQKFAVREKATADLEKLGDLAAKALRDRLQANPSLEMRQRMEKLVAKLNGPVQSPEVLQVLRGIETLERIGTREAREVLAALAKGAPGHRITEDARGALARLDRQAQMP